MEVSFQDRGGFLTGMTFGLSLVLFILLGSGCIRVTRPPEDLSYEEIPAYSWETLMLQESFRFDYHSYSKVFDFEVAGEGKVVMPDALRFKGIWRLGEEERELNLAAAGDYQLEKENGEWIARQRSEEAKIISQVDQVLRKALLRRKGKGFKLVEDAGKTLIYTFKPNLAYLDPKFEKKFDAELIIDGRTLIAEKINILSVDEEVGFNFSVDRINRVNRIGLPFSENFMIKYSPEWGGILRAKIGLKRRLRQLGRKSRIRMNKGQMEVTLALPVDEGIARMLGEPGELSILALQLEGSGPTINKRGFVSDIFYIADTLAQPKVRSAELGFDSLSRPYLEVEITNTDYLPGSFDYLGIAVDGELYEVRGLDTPLESTRISNVSTYQDAVALSLKLMRPIKAGLNYVGQVNLK